MNRKNFGKSILAARALLGWNRMDLASRAEIGHDTVARAERGEENVTRNALAAVQLALERAGVEFSFGTASPGVRLREDSSLQGCGVIADPGMPTGTRYADGYGPPG